jgi:hypothetical protein
MGGHIMKCYLGFSTTYANEFSEFLERRATELDRRYRQAHTELLNGLSSLHDAVDSALIKDGVQTTSNFSRGLAELAECNAHLLAMVDNLAGARADLTNRQKVDPRDPLIHRERFFSLIDFDLLYHDLVSCGAALPRQVFWDEVVSAIRSGGTQDALRLLESQLKDVQINLGAYTCSVGAMRHLPLEELPHALHDTSLSVSALVIGLIQFLTSCTYVSLICGRAMSHYEEEHSAVAA